MSGTLTDPGAQGDPDPEPTEGGCEHGFRWKAACKTCNPEIDPAKRRN